MCVLCRDRFIASLLATDFPPKRDKPTPTVAESSLPQEDVVVQRWWSLPTGTSLPLMNGDTYQLVFAGRSGGSAGPDVRDAVLQLSNGEQRIGDIEFHVRTNDWVAHRHATDPRYNNVILHVVLLCDDLQPTVRQDGYAIPVCSLYDIPIVFMPGHENANNEGWPCRTVMRNVSVTEQEKLLHRAGLLRFEQKTHAFVEELHKLETNRHCPFFSLSNQYNNCLIPALAEGLAYGRDRAFFRAAGQRLLGQDTHVPVPLGRASDPSPLDTKRLQVLRRLFARETNVWESLQHILVQTQQDTVLQTLRDYFCILGLSLARTDILI